LTPTSREPLGRTQLARPAAPQASVAGSARQLADQDDVHGHEHCQNKPFTMTLKNVQTVASIRTSSACDQNRAI
jgi:hypothetical protein